MSTNVKILLAGILLVALGDLGIYFIAQTNWWLLVTIPGGLMAGWGIAGTLHEWRKRRRWKKNQDDYTEWTDILDPHGDGTLREGDPIFDAMMRGNAVTGTFGPEGWVLKEGER